MPGVGDVLRRFRPVGSPGAAAVAGVPADRIGELAAELAPVFQLLDETLQECVRIRAEATREATRRQVVGWAEVKGLSQQARDHAAVERSDGVLRRRQEYERERQAELARAAEAAAQLRRVAEARLPALIQEIVSRVRSGEALRDQTVAR